MNQVLSRELNKDLFTDCLHIKYGYVEILPQGTLLQKYSNGIFLEMKLVDCSKLKEPCLYYMDVAEREISSCEQIPQEPLQASDYKILATSLHSKCNSSLTYMNTV